MEFARLKLFIQVAEVGSSSKAAVLLDSVQSAISRQIAALERDCGRRLFDRTGRGVTLTDFGKRVFSQIKALVLVNLIGMATAAPVQPAGSATVRTGTIDRQCQARISSTSGAATAVTPGWPKTSDSDSAFSAMKAGQRIARPLRPPAWPV